MGIKLQNLHQTIQGRFPSAHRKPRNAEEYDHVYIDVNSVFVPISASMKQHQPNPNADNDRIETEETYVKVREELAQLVKQFKPKKTLYFAMDGLDINVAKQDFKAAPSHALQSNMTVLNVVVSHLAVDLLSTHNITIVVDSAETAGEAELKIFRDVVTRAQGEETAVVITDDSDTLMLGLTSLRNNVDIYFSKSKVLYSVAEMVKQLETLVPSQSSDATRIEVAILFLLCGTDFIPQITDSLELDKYIELKKQGGADDNTINNRLMTIGKHGEPIINVDFLAKLLQDGRAPSTTDVFTQRFEKNKKDKAAAMVLSERKAYARKYLMGLAWNLDMLLHGCQLDSLYHYYAAANKKKIHRVTEYTITTRERLLAYYNETRPKKLGNNSAVYTVQAPRNKSKTGTDSKYCIRLPLVFVRVASAEWPIFKKASPRAIDEIPLKTPPRPFPKSDKFKDLQPNPDIRCFTVATDEALHNMDRLSKLSVDIPQAQPTTTNNGNDNNNDNNNNDNNGDAKNNNNKKKKKKNKDRKKTNGDATNNDDEKKRKRDEGEQQQQQQQHESDAKKNDNNNNNEGDEAQKRKRSKEDKKKKQEAKKQEQEKQQPPAPAPAIVTKQNKKGAKLTITFE